MLRLLTFVSVFLGAYCALEAISGADRVYFTKEIIESEGYPAEKHHVTTKDGYILEMHRIPFGRKSSNTRNRPVVFLMHGVLGASNSFIYLGPENAIAYNLADAGYDVWMGNARGTRNSRRHVRLDPDRNKLSFFDFTFEEIALDDLPSMFDYMLAHTGQEKFHYIGHSQGGTVFLVLNSMTNAYHSKIASAHLLAGVGYQRNFPNYQLKTLAATADVLYSVLRLAGSVEMYPPGSTAMFGKSSSRGMDDLFGLDVSSGLIGGAATKQIVLFGQNIRDRAFRRWDYGYAQNLIKYRQLSPPIYDLKKININVTMHYSLSDTLLSESDALLMVRDMPRATARKISRDSFTHLDYVTSKDVKVLLTDYIIQALRNS